MNAISEMISCYLTMLSKVCRSVARKLAHEQASDLDALDLAQIKKLRLSYDLTENACVFDVGGYEGQWASDIFSMYRCTIHVFEPIPEYADSIRNRFRKNSKIHVHKFGLSDHTCKTLISCEKDASSVFKLGPRHEQVKLIRLADFVSENKIRRVDLMKINIEGGEYDLLQHVIATGFVQQIENIQVQFHDFIPGAAQKMTKIQDRLANTHYLTYQYPFIWENWRRKRSSQTP